MPGIPHFHRLPAGEDVLGDVRIAGTLIAGGTAPDPLGRRATVVTRGIRIPTEGDVPLLTKATPIRHALKVEERHAPTSAPARR